MADVKKTQTKKKLNKKTAKAVKAPKKAPVKTTKNSSKKEIKVSATKSGANQKFYDQLKLSESYVSLILGAVVVVGISVLFLVFLRESRKTNFSKPEELNSAISPVLTRSPQQTYTMGENETLWDVAVKFYGDGFAYPRLIEANKTVITNPDFVPPGTVIIIPDAK